VRDLQAVRVDLEGTEDGIEVELQDGFPDLLPIQGAGTPDGLRQDLAARVAGGGLIREVGAGIGARG
jgi:hypothetical protein